ncbi:MAG: sigma 54-interacting transcriptional regulator [Desulfovibrionaceae bacterium]|nr:sigma 54-interacting transcriptional regulator [Desulfovibrionaceae bacterium]
MTEFPMLFQPAFAVCDCARWTLLQASEHFLELFPGARLGASLLDLRIGDEETGESPLHDAADAGSRLCREKDGFLLLLRWMTIRAPQSGESFRFLDVLRLPVSVFSRAGMNDSILHRVLDSIYDGIWVIDSRGITLAVNKSMERIADIRPEEVVGRHVAEAMRIKKFSACVTLHALEKKQRVSMFDNYANGQHCLNTSTPIFDENGEVQCVIAIIRNLADLEEIHASLDEMRVQSSNMVSENKLSVESGYWSGTSQAAQRLARAIAMAARTDAPVLLLGETGTGKTSVGKAIHQLSARRDSKFLALNCGAIPPSLVESELFGYDAGAFTGAQKHGRKGVFELADSGTLFLDELAELPLQTQATLLHALDGEPFRRVGGSASIQVNVRFIAATNKKLDRLVAEKRFREDLYYRLRVIVIELPPLRERRTDIPGLVRYFLLNSGSSRPVPHLNALLWKALMTYDWPGNIRELRSVMHYLIACDKETLSVEDLPQYIQQVLPQSGLPSAPASLREAVEAVEREAIRKALQEGGSTYKAARILKVSQATIVRKAQRYNLNAPIVEHRQS